MGYSTWGCKESDTTERLRTQHIRIQSILLWLMRKKKSQKVCGNQMTLWINLSSHIACVYGGILICLSLDVFIFLVQYVCGVPQCLSAGDAGSLPRSRRSPGGGHGNPLQYSCLENPMDKRAWWATIHRVAKSRTQVKRLTTHCGFHHVAIRLYSE